MIWVLMLLRGLATAVIWLASGLAFLCGEVALMAAGPQKFLANEIARRRR
jgi:hypothetical protein